MSRRWKNSKALNRKRLCCLEEVIDINIYIKVTSSKVSDRNEVHDFRNWKKGDSCFKNGRGFGFYSIE